MKVKFRTFEISTILRDVEGRRRGLDRTPIHYKIAIFYSCGQRYRLPDASAFSQVEPNAVDAEAGVGSSRIKIPHARSDEAHLNAGTIGHLNGDKWRVKRGGVKCVSLFDV
ncbi:hypothetical protein Trydic_g6379 [Trypoxylus dichotomus]